VATAALAETGAVAATGAIAAAKKGGCGSDGGVLCACAAAPGSLRRSAPSHTVFVLLRQGKRVRGGSRT